MRKLWSVREDQYVREHAGVSCAEEIAKKLGRSIKAVQLRSHRLKVNLFISRAKGSVNKETRYRILYDISTGKNVLEHRQIMAKYLGRPLKRTETIHHRNGKRADNRLRNLQLKLSAHGPGQSLRDRVRDLEDLGIKVIVPAKLKKVW